MNMSEIEFEMDGRPLSAKPGQMVIEAADAAGIYIPRFCWHKHLSVAANCRMCLIEVEKSGKPLPACATPVTPGMKVYTRSSVALSAQKAVMEFLLVNHPLDCPICDQGGECELQDLSMAHGADDSFFSERKRAVSDQNIGPLISTEMTRCIHCTRCVRFGEEIAGFRELGATGRGENMEIRVALGHLMQSEVSGNVIDLCPVGALTSKPFRFEARPFELSQSHSIAPHDCLGSNLNVHVRRGKVMRVVPRENPDINETWLSDRDRFSYEALHHADRLTKPLVRFSGRDWRETDWKTALETAMRSLRSVIDGKGPDQLAALASPSSTLEEFYLLQKMMRGLGSPHVDHRLRETGMEDQDEMGLFPGLPVSSLARLEEHDVILLVGSHIQHEQPLAALRIRKAMKRGTKVIVINMASYPCCFEADFAKILPPQDLPFALAGVANLLRPDAPPLPHLVVRESDRQIANQLLAAKKVGVYAGIQAFHHPAAADIRRLLRHIAESCGTQAGWFTEGANAAGAWIAGAIPHRGACGQKLAAPGLPAAAVWKNPRSGYLLLNVEPDLDCAHGQVAMDALRRAESVVALSSFRHPALLETASVILPVTPFTETAGTFVNAMGQWQTFSGMAIPVGESRPAWKVLRVLGNLLSVADFDYAAVSEVTAELNGMMASAVVLPVTPGKITLSVRGSENSKNPELQAMISRVGPVPLYSGDAACRRAPALQAAQRESDGFFAGIRLHPLTASMLGVEPGDRVLVCQGAGRVLLTVRVDESIPREAALVPAGLPETAALGEFYGPLEILKP